jgi:hypothetical protein
MGEDEKVRSAILVTRFPSLACSSMAVGVIDDCGGRQRRVGEV